MILKAGDRLGPYEVVGLIGAGGMGEVYRGRDTRLNRTIAIKVLSPSLGSDPEFRHRFEREGRLASVLDHPHICTVFDVGVERGVAYLVMQHVGGETLADLLARSAVPLDAALDYAIQIASALAAAHRASILHRDLKPSNIMVADGSVKILDFGLAKSTAAGPSDETGALHGSDDMLSRPGIVLGTAAYMSPEQVHGRILDARSDVFSFGAVLYEMLTGRRAFAGNSAMTTAFAVVNDSPPPARQIRPGIHADLDAIIRRCLEKDPAGRYSSATEVHDALRAFEAQLRMSSPVKPAGRRLRKLITVAGVAVALGAVGLIWATRRQAGVREAIARSLPEITRLSEQGEYAAAFRLALDAERHIPDDPRLAELWREISLTVNIESEPAGADISLKEYTEPDAPWQVVGTSPLNGLRISRGLKRWRITKSQHESVDAALAPEELSAFKFTLAREAGIPPAMVRVTGSARSIGLTGLDHLQVGFVDDFFIDRYEVTNEEYAQFVRAGGYRRPEYWKHPFVKDGKILPFEEAVEKFRDTTERPGPATWELGNYPPGKANLPVAGVSWFEAAAYAVFAGKDLPTVHHWMRAAVRASVLLNNSPVLRLSNFTGGGPAAVGTRMAMNPYGTFDMAGNVKEWCANEAAGRAGARFILGGAYGEPVYMAHDPDAQAPFGRLPTYGVRLVKYLSPPPASVHAPIDYPSRDFAHEKPVADAEFDVLRRFYSYDRTPLDARVESVDDANPSWRLEKVSFNTAYDNQRMTAYLFLPRGLEPPYQVVVHFPPSPALRERSFEARLKQEMSPQQYLGVGINFLVQSGRAVMFPIYKSTYERGDELVSDRPNLTNRFRDHVVQWTKDFRRSLDYLETRGDVDATKVGYYGVSWGATMGAIIPAVEPRLKALVLVVGGFWQQRAAPEVEQLNFVPRVTAPALMLNGRNDFVFPLETSQLPMFTLLGTPSADKHHVIVESGHSVPARALVTSTLQWFDRYLGPTGK
jgi:eukaryotic-like serine/threonine-protein kinase